MQRHSFSLPFVVFAVAYTVFARLTADDDLWTVTNNHTTASVNACGCSLFTTTPSMMVIGQCGGFFKPKHHRSLPVSLVALLLLISGLQINPGPSISIGSFNVRSVVLRGSLILDMINTHNLDALAVCETWITSDDTEVTKMNLVPAGYRVHHVPRPTATSRTRGGGLCFVHRDSLVVKPHPLQQSMQFKSFELQLLTLSVRNRDPGRGPSGDSTFVIANIYQPESSTSVPPAFFDDLSELFSKFGDSIDNDRFVACGDFNCAGDVPTSINDDLESLFDVLGL